MFKMTVKLPLPWLWCAARHAASSAKSAWPLPTQVVPEAKPETRCVPLQWAIALVWSSYNSSQRASHSVTLQHP